MWGIPEGGPPTTLVHLFALAGERCFSIQELAPSLVPKFFCRGPPIPGEQENKLMSDNDNETPSTETKGLVSKTPENKPKTIQKLANACFLWGMRILSGIYTLRSFAKMVKELIVLFREVSDDS